MIGRSNGSVTIVTPRRRSSSTVASTLSTMRHTWCQPEKLRLSPKSLYGGRSTAPAPASSSILKFESTPGATYASFKSPYGHLGITRKSSFSVYHAIASAMSGTRTPAWSPFIDVKGLDVLAGGKVDGMLIYALLRRIRT